MPGEHAKLAPSSAARWMRCPGSHALEAALPNTSSKAADEGTFAHWIASECLDPNARHSPIWYKGKVSDCGRFTVDDEMLDAVQTYLDAVSSVLISEGGTLYVEQKVTMSAPTAPDVWGTADALVFSERRLDVFDFKYGAGVFVDVEDNEQGMIYAAAAIVTLSKEHPDIDHVRIHIVQPRHHRGPAWRWFDVPTPELARWAGSDCLPAAKKAAADGGKTLVPGEKQCQFCRAATTCKARNAEARELALQVFDEPVDGELVPKTADVPGLPPDDIGRMLEMFPRVEAFIKAVRERAADLAHGGVEIPGHKLVTTQGNRAWKDATAAAEYMRSIGVDPDAPAKTLSPAAAEKAVAAALPASKKEAAAQLAPLTTRPEAKKLVPHSDSRAPVKSAAAVFSD